MKIINQLIIRKNQFKIINQNIKINKLTFKDLNDKDDPFILENKDYLLNTGFLNYWFYLIRDFKLFLTNQEINKIIKAIKTNANYSIEYAESTGKRFSEGEAAISQDPRASLRYANNLNKRWTELEDIDIGIARTAEYNIAITPAVSFFYAEKILKKPWRDVNDIDPETKRIAELTILSKSSGTYNSTDYAIKLLKSRWSELEKKILSNDYDFEGLKLFIDYIKKFNDPNSESFKNLLLKFEDLLLKFKDIQLMADYAKEIIGDRWPEAEEEMLRQKKCLDDFELEELELLNPYIYDDSEVIEGKIIETIEKYAEEVIDGPWPEAEIE
jgi:hypothetical protein